MKTALQNAVIATIMMTSMPAAGQEQQEATAAAQEGVIGARLQGLDKITARIFAFDAPFGEAVEFGYLTITVEDCVVSAEDEAPERAAFLEIVAAKPETEAVEVFSGWMFASSPSVSAMEHPVYDVWVVDCLREGGPPSDEVQPPPLIVGPEVQLPTDGEGRPLD